MKTIKIKNLIIASAMVIALGSCSKDYITTEPKGEFLTDSYYKTQEQAYAALIAAYDVLGKNSGGFDNMMAMMNAGSDDHVAGGGGPSDGLQIHAFTNFQMSGITSQDASGLWGTHFQGIFRTNILLEKLPTIPMDASLITRYTAEAKAIRALCYFNLVRMYKNVPLMTKQLTATEINDVTQATPSAVYAQIELDLLDAINDLPNTITVGETGRLSKGAAKALLGKVYLYEGKNGLAAAQFADVNGTPGGTSMFGYRLATNFSDLWITSNKFNAESIIEASHTNTGNASWGGVSWGTEGNVLNVMVGPRGYVKNDSFAPALPSGWSFNVFTQDFYDVAKLDPRFPATLLDLKALKLAGHADYIPGDADTGYFLNKFLPRNSDVTPGTGDAVLNYQQNTYIIRLADTYLMEAEALGASSLRALDLVNAIRVRAGAAPLATLTMNDIKLERRLELAGEGHRFFDLVRWGDASSKLGSRGFVAGKNEVFPIPYKELENTKLVQNPGYN